MRLFYSCYESVNLSKKLPNFSPNNRIFRVEPFAISLIIPHIVGIDRVTII